MTALVGSITRHVSSRKGHSFGDAAYCAESRTRRACGCSDSAECMVNMRCDVSATNSCRVVDIAIHVPRLPQG